VSQCTLRQGDYLPVWTVNNYLDTAAGTCTEPPCLAESRAAVRANGAELLTRAANTRRRHSRYCSQGAEQPPQLTLRRHR